MKVSIIIPAYNEEKNLPACLDSISKLNFSKEDLEVILVDNGSIDRTLEIAESFGAITLSDDSMNVSGLRNYGVKHSSGDILAFVDADCVVSQDWLKNSLPYFNLNNVAAWGAPPTLPENATWVQQTWYIVRQKEKQVQEVSWLETMNLFVRKNQFVAVGGFNETLVTCEDVDLCYRIRKYGKIISDSRLVVIHHGEASTLSAFFKKELWRGRSNLKGLRSHGLSLKEIPSLLIPFYFGIFLPAALIGTIFLFTPASFAFFFLLYMLPSSAVLFRVRKKQIEFSDLLKLLLLIQIYFFSRTGAVLAKE